MTKKPRPAPAYRNVYVQVCGRDYRVTFHVGLRKPMFVCLRNNGRDARPLDLEGPTARKVVAAAREQLRWLLATDLVETISRMTFYEDDSPTAADDAIETMNNLIGRAQEIVG